MGAAFQLAGRTGRAGRLESRPVYSREAVLQRAAVCISQRCESHGHAVLCYCVLSYEMRMSVSMIGYIMKCAPRSDRA